MKNYKTPMYIAIAVFITCLTVLFLGEQNSMNVMILAVSAGYGIVCLGFLLFQLYAFIKVHTDYDEDVEAVKYQVFEAEGVRPSLEEDYL